MAARPSIDPIAEKLRRWLPSQVACSMVRWKNVLYGMYVFQMCRKYPAKVKSMLLGQVQKEMGPTYDVATHFTPRYNPWEQRLCLVPDSDFFNALKSQKASVVTYANKVTALPWVDFSSGYFRRAKDILPKQGAAHPWRLYPNYVFDLVTLRFGSVRDSAMEFCI
jgi:hypothetical protein